MATTPETTTPEMTAITDITWSSQDAQDTPALDQERQAKLLAMFSEGKTLGQIVQLSNVETIRYFRDAPAAQEFVDFIWEMDTKYGPGLVISAIVKDAV